MKITAENLEAGLLSAAAGGIVVALATDHYPAAVAIMVATVVIDGTVRAVRWWRSPKHPHSTSVARSAELARAGRRASFVAGNDWAFADMLTKSGAGELAQLTRDPE